MKTKLLFAAIAFTFFSCNRAENKSAPVADYGASEMPQSDSSGRSSSGLSDLKIPIGKVASPDSAGLPASAPANLHTNWDSKIIKHASMKVEVKDFKKYNAFVHNAVKQYGGYVAQEEQSLSDDKSETTITIKVPVSQFEDMMNNLPADDGKVMEKKISTDDVTGEVVDTKSRLEAKKQLRLKYLEFLKQSKNMEEVLQVQNEVDDIQQQIESAAGRVSFLNNQVAFSTISLVFYQPMEGYSAANGTPGFFAKVAEAFKTGGSWLADIFLGLVSIWPILLIVCVVYFGWKKMKPAKAIAPKS